MLASPRTRMVRSGKEPATQTGECRLPSSAAAKRAAPRSPEERSRQSGWQISSAVVMKQLQRRWR